MGGCELQSGRHRALVELRCCQQLRGCERWLSRRRGVQSAAAVLLAGLRLLEGDAEGGNGATAN